MEWQVSQPWQATRSSTRAGQSVRSPREIGEEVGSPVGHPKAPSPGSLGLLAWSQGRWWLVRPGEPGMSLTISFVPFLNKAAGKQCGGVGKSNGQGSRVLGLTPTPVGRGSVMWTSGFFGLGFSTWSMEPSGWRSSRRPPAPPWVCLGSILGPSSCPLRGNRGRDGSWPRRRFEGARALFPVPSEPRSKARRITVPVCPGLGGGGEGL